ncbi:hypothetical protein SGGMMB4_02490 [Sodalis glossinidius str. 'morsitans']|uniref:Uncharacterized protein n=1 Tax=Sodalis glossinidius (strain morsitans) TaxID=343509 RepID=A0A193QJB8_SODGM|nr:hypothetical protein SGGMMB4_02490 [Sodalis glossinidius str. 'morsitans']
MVGITVREDALLKRRTGLCPCRMNHRLPHRRCRPRSLPVDRRSISLSTGRLTPDLYWAASLSLVHAASRARNATFLPVVEPAKVHLAGQPERHHQGIVALTLHWSFPVAIAPRQPCRLQACARLALRIFRCRPSGETAPWFPPCRRTQRHRPRRRRALRRGLTR